MSDKPETWHYGLVARYWAEHNLEGPEIAYFQAAIEENGEPALDAGCGTGRLLIPFLQAGLEVDGCDLSGDMLALCQARAEQEGLSPRLYRQALHELALPRSYQTIVACGVFGIGGSRQQDRLAMERFYSHLKPGGLLLLDNYLPYEDAREWHMWPRAERQKLPEDWPEGMGEVPPEGGSGYRLYTRVVGLDPLEQQIAREMRTMLWEGGKVTAEATYRLTENLYFRNEMRLLLQLAGFEVEAVQAGYSGAEATAKDEILVYRARRPR